MSLLTNIESLYGQVRGYERLSIRKQVAENVNRSASALIADQQALLRNRIRHAVRHFPLYRNHVEDSRKSLTDLDKGDFDLSSFPIWTREKQNEWFKSQQVPPFPKAIAHATGGSTGTPTRLWISRESYEWRYAVSQRGYSWAQAEDGQNIVYIWGAPAKPLPAWKQWKQHIHHKILGHTIFNSFSFGEERMAECCALINRVRPRAIVGYTGNLIALSQFVSRHPERLQWKARTVIGAAEGLQLPQRKIIEQHLAEEVFMSYGSREFMLIGMEHNDHRGYWLTDDNLYTEVVDEHGIPLPPGKSGRIVVTDLRNDASPMIRYEIGDMGTMAETKPQALFPFRKLASVDGRSSEFIHLPNGDTMTALFIPHLMKEFDWIQAYQIHQNTNQGMSIHFRTTHAPTETAFQPIKEAFAKYVPRNFVIDFKEVNALETRPNGKTPIVINKFANR